jgi:hypothetical protein
MHLTPDQLSFDPFHYVIPDDFADHRTLMLVRWFRYNGAEIYANHRFRTIGEAFLALCQWMEHPETTKVQVGCFWWDGEFFEFRADFGLDGVVTFQQRDFSPRHRSGYPTYRVVTPVLEMAQVAA